MTNEEAAASGSHRKCFHCNEPVRRDANVCPHCRREVKPWRFRHGSWWAQTDDGSWHRLDAATNTWVPYERPGDPADADHPDIPTTAASPAPPPPSGGPNWTKIMIGVLLYPLGIYWLLRLFGRRIPRLSDKRVAIALAAIISAVLTVGVAVSGSGKTTSASAESAGSSSESSMTLSEAFCSDLRKGYSPFQILGQSVQDGTYTPKEAADSAYGMAAISCADELKTNQLLRSYVQNWNIDPDA